MNRRDFLKTLLSLSVIPLIPKADDKPIPAKKEPPKYFDWRWVGNENSASAVLSGSMYSVDMKEWLKVPPQVTDGES